MRKISNAFMRFGISTLPEASAVALGFKAKGEEFFHVATDIERWIPDIHSARRSSGPGFFDEQSQGESFSALLLERFGEQGLYALAEPEAVLFPQRQLLALSGLHQRVNEKYRLIIATHSPA